MLMPLPQHAARCRVMAAACLLAIAAAPPATAVAQATQAVAVSDLPNRLFSDERSREVLRAQILLDRAHFSPGVIDGYMGGNTARAIEAWQSAHGMAPTGVIDDALLSRLADESSRPLLQRYTLTDADVGGPFGPIPSGMAALSKLDSTHYETLAEAMAEKFHMSKAMLTALNPEMDGAKAGATITVAAVRQEALPQVARIEVDAEAARVRAYDREGTMLATFPATVGSAEFPSPSGSMKVRAIAPKPTYYFSPEGRSWGPDEKLQIAAGPNNPVGSTWIDLTKEGYGIHGTPDPRLIGKTASHGCVRLTNWDAKTLAAAVSAGVEVVFV